MHLSLEVNSFSDCCLVPLILALEILIFSAKYGVALDSFDCKATQQGWFSWGLEGCGQHREPCVEEQGWGPGSRCCEFLGWLQAGFTLPVLALAVTSNSEKRWVWEKRRGTEGLLNGNSDAAEKGTVPGQVGGDFVPQLC